MGRKANLRKHEVLGLVYQFLGSTSIGVGIYYAVWFAVRPIYFENLIVLNSEWLFFPLFFGLGSILLTLGHIELREAQPGNKR